MSKFNKEQKIEIYRKWKDEKISISQLSKTYKTNVANLDYMLRLIDMYGINVLDRSKIYYSWTYFCIKLISIHTKSSEYG